MWTGIGVGGAAGTDSSPASVRPHKQKVGSLLRRRRRPLCEGRDVVPKVGISCRGSESGPHPQITAGFPSSSEEPGRSKIVDFH